MMGREATATHLASELSSDELLFLSSINFPDSITDCFLATANQPGQVDLKIANNFSLV